ncbi:MAG: DNA-3-methyladenine glycosylase family protein [Bacillota bacterium]
MNIKEIENGVIIEGIRDFDAECIFDCGQSFRWNRQSDGSYTGAAFGKVINVSSDYESSTVVIKNTNPEDFNNIWYDYFDLGRDYSHIKSVLSQDPVMEMAIEHGKGIRILRQEPWELVISYIISANNSIPNISKSINLLSRMFGKPIIYENTIYYSFPTPEELEKGSIEDLAECRAGFRCKYIYSAVRMILSGEIDLKRIQSLETEAARSELMRLPGVGPKVADCIMLFSMGKYDTYPVDVWIKRVTEYFFVGRDVTLKDIQKFAKDKFGELAGFAQEYLFYYARMKKIM